MIWRQKKIGGGNAATERISRDLNRPNLRGHRMARAIHGTAANPDHFDVATSEDSANPIAGTNTLDRYIASGCRDPGSRGEAGDSQFTALAPLDGRALDGRGGPRHRRSADRGASTQDPRSIDRQAKYATDV
jgi:hypothetical protein